MYFSKKPVSNFSVLAVTVVKHIVIQEGW